MDSTSLALFASDALLLALRLALPALGACLLVGLVVGFLQAVTQTQDGALGFLPKLAAVSGALIMSHAFLGDELTLLYGRVIEQIALVAR